MTGYIVNLLVTKGFNLRSVVVKGLLKNIRFIKKDDTGINVPRLMVPWLEVFCWAEPLQSH